MIHVDATVREGVKFAIGWALFAGVLAFVGYALLAWPTAGAP